MTDIKIPLETIVVYSREYLEARKDKLPCVALESAVISKGLPYRDNFWVAKKCEEVIRREKAVPVTFGLWEGQIVAGMSEEQIGFFARHPQRIHKVNLQNLSYVLSRKLYGATTVAATVYLAALLGIPIMATGGIGGVHKNVERIMDISSDLKALVSNPVAVVSSGIKCILDIAKTLELLETLGVPVVGYKTSFFPLFYANESIYPIEQSFQNTVDIANYLRYHFTMFPGQGVLIANPVPDRETLDYSELQNMIESSLEKAEKKSIKGKEVTPFLLNELAQRTGENSIAVNKALLISNSLLAAQLAKELTCKR